MIKSWNPIWLTKSWVRLNPGWLSAELCGFMVNAWRSQSHLCYKINVLLSRFLNLCLWAAKVMFGKVRRKCAFPWALTLSPSLSFSLISFLRTVVMWGEVRMTMLVCFTWQRKDNSACLSGASLLSLCLSPLSSLSHSYQGNQEISSIKSKMQQMLHR